MEKNTQTNKLTVSSLYKNKAQKDIRVPPKTKLRDALIGGLYIISIDIRTRPLIRGLIIVLCYGRR